LQLAHPKNSPRQGVIIGASLLEGPPKFFSLSYPSARDPHVLESVFFSSIRREGPAPPSSNQRNAAVLEQWHNGPPPQGMKEVFNHAHAKVRNVIERSFGVLKMKFRILLNMQRFLEDKQTRIIVACMALHNFIRESRIAD
jgi:hypothetical protein